MASFGPGSYVVILVSFGSASAGDIQFVMQREAQSGKVWFPAGGLLPNETHVSSIARVLLCETGLPFSSGDLALIRDEVISITLSDGTKQHV
jgi:8-oxo-dGTP pyrophosphatase MutT (NUDIX family)